MKLSKLVLATTTAISDDDKTQPPDLEPPHKKRKEECEISVSQEEEIKRISNGEKLSDVAINWAQDILKATFPHLDGLFSTLYQQRKNKIPKVTSEGLQIIHVRSGHWIVVSTLGCPEEQLLVFDSFYNSIDDECAELLLRYFPDRATKMVNCQKQNDGTACGVFAIANATSLAYGLMIYSNMMKIK